MRQCPHCHAAVPDRVVRCPACGGVLPPPVRLSTDAQRRPPLSAPGTPKWVPVAYNIIAGYWILSGGFSLVSALAHGGGKTGSYVAAAFGLFTVLIGLGLLLRIEIVRGIVNVLCALQIIGGAIGVLGAFLRGAPLELVLSFVQIGTAGFMIYLIGETDTSAPNW